MGQMTSVLSPGNTGRNCTEVFAADIADCFTAGTFPKAIQVAFWEPWFPFGLWLLIWADFKSCLGLTHLLSLCHTYSPLHYVNFSIPEQQKGSSDDSSAVVEKGGGGNFCACLVSSRVSAGEQVGLISAATEMRKSGRLLERLWSRSNFRVNELL